MPTRAFGRGRLRVLCCAALLTGCGAEPNASPAEGDATPSPATTPGPATARPTAMPSPPRPTPRISFEDVARHPLPGTVIPGAIRFAPDGEHLTWLHSSDDSLSRELFAYELAEGQTRRVAAPPDGGEREEELSLEEKLRRERARSRALGITRYAWAKKGQTLLLPIAGDLFVKDGIDGELRALLDRKQWCEATGCDPKKPTLDARLSPAGDQVAFVYDAELYVMPTDGSAAPKQITKGARGTGKTHGLAEYIAQEEMKRHHGWWWSPDGSQIAFTEVDETHIPIYRIVHQGSEGTGEGHEEDHAYPFAGGDNARVRLGVVSVRGGSPRWAKLDIPDNGYLARVDWTPGGELLVQTQDRAQQSLWLDRVDPRSGTPTRLLEERSEVWINLHRLLRPLGESFGELEGHFIWGSESSGFMHLYLHAPDGSRVRALTEGEWMVESILGVDAKRQKLWFTGTKDGPLERHLYEVGLDGEGLRRLTPDAGMHAIVLNAEAGRFVDTHSANGRPLRVELRDLEHGTLQAQLFEAKAPELEAMGVTPPELVTMKARDGLELHGAIYAPDPERFGPGPYPTLVSVYGGPHAQRVSNSWGMVIDMRAQALRERGYLVFKLDNRGSARRGLAFEGEIKHDMGNLEVRDQVDGVRWLVEQKLCDPKRVGIYGWSYGGYMSAMALARAPETFVLGIAGAPVTHWDGYDTHYTERYMGTPQSNPEGYARSSVMAHLETLRGDLMLVHGLIDENVHFRHSARLIQALIEARKPYTLQMFPGERHVPRKLEDRVYMEEQIFAFIDARFQPEAAPAVPLEPAPSPAEPVAPKGAQR